MLGIAALAVGFGARLLLKTFVSHRVSSSLSAPENNLQQPFHCATFSPRNHFNAQRFSCRRVLEMF